METNENDTPEESAPAPAKPALKPGVSQLTTTLIVIIVLLLFVMLMLSKNSKLFQSSGGKESDLATLKSRNNWLRADANAKRARRGLPPLPENSGSVRIMADRLQRDAASLAALTGQWQMELEAKDATLRQYQNDLTSHNENTRHLYIRIASLQSKLDKNTHASNQLASLGNDLKMANNQADNYRKQLAVFQEKPSDAQVATLRKQLAESLDARGKLGTEIDTLLQRTKNSVARSKYGEAMAELAKLRPSLNKQRYEIQQLRALRDRPQLFIESAKDLPAEAARLFARLHTLEHASTQQLNAAYQNIGTTLGSRIIHRQTFAKNSSQITFDREKMIRDILDKRKDSDSFFLVVGYASKSGGANTNRRLSANRATTVASVINILKTSGQQVKAVYLGETTRFSKTEEIENQVCEIWEIKG